MSIFGALNIGQSALTTSQAALQVTGNNIANVGNANYARETADVEATPDQQVSPGVYLGTGVNLVSVNRQVSEALNARVRSAASDSQAATTSQNYLSQVEATFNALGTSNISTSMSTFFGDWSNLANNPQDGGLRQVVLQDGQALATSLSSEKTQLATIQTNIQQQISSDATTANGYAQQIASLNTQIVASQGSSGGTANALEDQRDTVLKKLSGLTNITTVPQGDGSVNVYVGSEPLVIAGQSSGVAVTTQTVNGAVTSTVRFAADGAPLNSTSGEMAALQTAQTQTAASSTQVDTLAHNIIGAVNSLTASGQGTVGFTTVTGTTTVGSATTALNSAATDLQYTPTNGSFVVSVTNAAGVTNSTLVPVTLTGSAADTTLNSLTASLNGISGVKASVTNGKLTIASATPGSTITFSQDSSGTLAALGVNTFFSGSTASDMAVNSTVTNQPSLITAAKNGDAGDNQTAVAIAALNTQSIASTGNMSLQDSYQSIVSNVSGQVANANTNVEATSAISSTLAAQYQALSGVSMDEESVNMLEQQRAYQGAAVFITTVNNMMTSLLAMVP